MLRTIAETAVFTKFAADIWREDELMAFKTWLASNPEAGSVITETGGLRKVRWVLEGNNKGKSGGVRVIYFNEHGGKIWLLITYTKSKFDSLPKKFLRKLKEEIENA